MASLRLVVLTITVGCLALLHLTEAKANFNAKQSSSKISKKGGTEDGTEQWAYVDVRPNAHMFYWLYYTSHPDGHQNRPLILWLQGGPGASSTGYGNFEIIGPLDLDLNPRNTTWVKQASILFIDNPVGSGYSYVDSPDAYTTDVSQITADLITIFKAFLEEYPDFKTAPFYVFGQSYGGKMGAHFARTLHDEILLGNVESRLMGFAMGNSWISPIDSTLTWGPFLYYMSTTDDQGMAAIEAEGQKAQAAIDAGDWELATYYWGSTEMVVIDKTNGVDFYNILNFVDYWGNIRDVHEFRLGLKKHMSSLNAIQASAERCQTAVEEERWTDATNLWRLTEVVVARRSNSVDFYNILNFNVAGGANARTRQHSDFGQLYKQIFKPDAKAGDPLDDLMNGPIREKLGIIPATVVWGGQSDAVFNYQEGDFMKPVVDVVDSALQNTTLKVIVYQGQLDLICDTKASLDWVQQFKWDKLGDYNVANRNAFVDPVTKQTDLFVKAYNNFKFYWVLRAGHAVPKDAGETAFRMLDRILNDLDT